MYKKISLATVMTFALGLVSTASSETLKLSIETSSATGSVRAAVFSSAKAFDQGEILRGVVSPAKVGMTRLEFNNLEPGTYGIAVFQDLNENEELDTNLFGAPNEPFGFSNNPVIKFSAPKFEEFKFEFDGKLMELSITLNGG